MNELVASFTTEQAERLTGVSRRRLAYWHKAGLVPPAFSDDGGWVGMRHLYSFKNLVNLRILLVLHESYGIRMGMLHQADTYLSERYEKPWTNLVFYVLAGELLFDEPTLKLRLAAARPGQIALPFEIKPVLEEIRAEVRLARERRLEDVGVVQAHPKIQSGATVLAGTRVTTRAIFEYHQAGYNKAAILEAYPSLEAADIAAAIKYEEKQLAARRGKKLTA